MKIFSWENSNIMQDVNNKDSVHTVHINIAEKSYFYHMRALGSPHPLPRSSMAGEEWELF
jgi:hypothetical protein